MYYVYTYICSFIYIYILYLFQYTCLYALAHSLPFFCKALSLSPLESEEACHFKDIMLMLSSTCWESLGNAGTYARTKSIIQKEMLVNTRPCLKHKQCCLPVPDWDMSGPHCTEHSTMGGGAGREGDTPQYFLTLCKYHKSRATPILTLENVTTGEFSDMVYLALVLMLE